MRWDIEKAAQFIKQGDFEYLQGLEYTEEEQALIDAIMYVEREYHIDVVTDLKALNFGQETKIKTLEQELKSLYDLLERCQTTLEVIERPLGEIKGDIDAFFEKEEDGFEVLSEGKKRVLEEERIARAYKKFGMVVL